MRPVLVVSPHLDDAVLSAGQFLAGRPDAVVLTICAGTPPHALTTGYDTKCGFADSTSAMAHRRNEDRMAMALLGCSPVHADFLDGQYGPSPDRDEVAKRIDEQIRCTEPEFLVGPLGLVHADHHLTRDAFLDVAFDYGIGVWLYEDLPYRVNVPESVPTALNQVQSTALRAELGFIGTGSLSVKMGALWAYASQMMLPEFENKHALLVPERFWSITCQ